MLPIIRNNHTRSLRGADYFRPLIRWFDDFFDEATTTSHWGNIDVYEDDKNLYVEAELPGFKRDQISLTLQDGLLHLEARRDDKTEEKKENYYVRERRQGKWARSIQLPEIVQEDKVEATYNDGVLKITLEKQPERKVHKIEVK